MNVLSGISVSTSAIFNAANQTQAQRQNVSNMMLSTGITAMQGENYEKAIVAFKGAVAMSPESDNAPDIYNYMANAYLQLGKNAEAAKAYKNSLQAENRDDTHIKLGNLYYAEGNYDGAEAEYKAAVEANPSSTSNVYSLGQLYLQIEEYDEAETQFRKVVTMAPNEYGGYYGLGQTYRLEGKTEDAVEQFQEAIEKKSDFAYGYVDLGYAYADLGNEEDANAQAEILDDMDSTLADDVRDYLYTVTPAKMLYAYSTNGFNMSLGKGTAVSDLDASLATPNASRDFSVSFIIDKEMDLVSIQDRFNWAISKATTMNAGGAYNWGLGSPETEVSVSPIPKNVIYDPYTYTVKVTFTLTQNAEGNGTIDPSHIVFKFMGKDVTGLTMSSSGDEYDGAGGAM